MNKEDRQLFDELMKCPLDKYPEFWEKHNMPMQERKDWAMRLRKEHPILFKRLVDYCCKLIRERDGREVSV